MFRIAPTFFHAKRAGRVRAASEQSACCLHIWPREDGISQFMTCMMMNENGKKVIEVGLNKAEPAINIWYMPRYIHFRAVSWNLRVKIVRKRNTNFKFTSRRPTDGANSLKDSSPKKKSWARKFYCIYRQHVTDILFRILINCRFQETNVNCNNRLSRLYILSWKVSRLKWWVAGKRSMHTNTNSWFFRSVVRATSKYGARLLKKIL
jgi:hypothetical protein